MSRESDMITLRSLSLSENSNEIQSINQPNQSITIGQGLSQTTHHTVPRYLVHPSYVLKTGVNLA